uniref:Uncharacterized protein n=1 Tax=Pristionchus pacificus TaxID=54126 RepID=A0A8R1UPQ8_PRIPA
MAPTRFARNERVYVKMKSLDPGAFLATITDVTVDKKHRIGYSIRFEDKDHSTLRVEFFNVPYCLFKEADVRAGGFEMCIDEECIGYVVGEDYLGRRSREEVIAEMELSILTYDVGEKIKCRTRKEDPGWWKAEKFKGFHDRIQWIEPQEAKHLMKKARRKSTKGKRRRKPAAACSRKAKCLSSNANQQLPPAEMNDQSSEEEDNAVDDAPDNDQLVSGISHDHCPSADSLNRTLPCPSSHSSLDRPQTCSSSSPHSPTASSLIDRSNDTRPSPVSVSNIMPASNSPEGNGFDGLMKHYGRSGSGIRTTGEVHNGSLPTLMELAGLVHRESITNPCSSSSHESSSSSTLVVTINDDEMDDRPQPPRFFMRLQPPYRPNVPSVCSTSNSYPSARSFTFTNPSELNSPSSGSESNLSQLYDMLDELVDGNFIDIHAESDAMKANFLEQMSDMKGTFNSMWMQMRRMEKEKADEQRKRRKKEKTKDDRIAQLEKELKNAQEKALQKTKSLDVKVVQITQLESDKAELARQMKEEMKKENEITISKSSKLSSQNEKLKEELEELKKKELSLIKENNIQISKLSSQNEKLKEELEELKKKELSLIKENNIQISKLSSQNEKLKEELEELKKKELSLIKDKEIEISELLNQNEKLKEELEDQNNREQSFIKDKEAEFDLLVMQRDAFRKKYIEQIKKNYAKTDAQKKGKSTVNRKDTAPMNDGDTIASHSRAMQILMKKFNKTECKAFEAGFTDKENAKKDFSAIKEKCLPFRSIGDLLQYYYGWKGPHNGKYILHAKSKSAQFDLIAKGGVDLGPRKRTIMTNQIFEHVAGRATNKRRKKEERIVSCPNESDQAQIASSAGEDVLDLTS